MRRAGPLLVAVLLSGLCLTPVTHGAGSPTETYPQLLTQVASGAVTSALVNRRGHDVKVTLRDSSTVRVVYPSRQERQLVARLKAGGSQVKYTRRRHASAHHVLRYIGGAVVIVIIAAGGGMFLYTRRRPPSDGRADSQ